MIHEIHQCFVFDLLWRRGAKSNWFSYTCGPRFATEISRLRPRPARSSTETMVENRRLPFVAWPTDEQARLRMTIGTCGFPTQQILYDLYGMFLLNQCSVERGRERERENSLVHVSRTFMLRQIPNTAEITFALTEMIIIKDQCFLTRLNILNLASCSLSDCTLLALPCHFGFFLISLLRVGLRWPYH